MSSLQSQLLLAVLVNILIKFTLSADPSDRLSFLNQVLVFGHRNPDTDSIIGALVYADYLRRQKINAKAYRLGDLNNETKFVLKKAKVKIPDLLPSHIAKGTAVALVDHNESKCQNSS